MDERYYITDLEQKIIKAVKRASDTAENKWEISEKYAASR